MKWSRPDIPSIDPATYKLVFQQVDLDTYVDAEGTPHCLDKTHPHVRGHHTVIRLYGVTDEGYSVMTHLHGYIPYFYASLPSETFTSADCERFKVAFLPFFCLHIPSVFFLSKIFNQHYEVKCVEKM